jgi:hypothetical protein
MELNGIRISTVRELIQMRATQVFIVRIRTIIFERNTFIGAGATQYLLLSYAKRDIRQWGLN